VFRKLANVSDVRVDYSCIHVEQERFWDIKVGIYIAPRANQPASEPWDVHSEIGALAQQQVMS